MFRGLWTTSFFYGLAFGLGSVLLTNVDVKMEYFSMLDSEEFWSCESLFDFLKVSLSTMNH